MAQIQFRAKVVTVYNHDDTPAWQYVTVPKLARSHCDMAAFRKHPKYGSYANSDLFPAMLERIAREVVGPYSRDLRLDKAPANVTIDASGFLALVTIEV